MSEITPEIVAEHGLSEDEWKLCLEIMGREPNLNELGIFSVMWSEHCSYKSSKKWLKTLPTEAPWVICGPGENAGVIDIEDKGDFLEFHMRLKSIAIEETQKLEFVTVDEQHWQVLKNFD